MQSDEIRQNIALRPYQNEDLPFMQQLYFSVREQELASVNFSTAEKNAFLSQQFSAQYLHYTQHYSTDAFNIIETLGKPIGRFFVDYWSHEIRIVDIALMPKYRNLGIGSYLLNMLFIEAKKNNLPVTIHVEHNNPAKKLYERLGFKLKSNTNDIYLLMERVSTAC